MRKEECKLSEEKVVAMMRHSITLDTESGQTMAEYAVVLGMITFVIVTTFSLLSDQIVTGFERTLSILTSVA
jgi:Flp pilus assembly pilin Flp